MRSEEAAARLALDRANALLLVVDVQERLAKAMPAPALATLEKNAAILVRAARRLQMPVVATEQYPKGLGPTVPSLRELLPADPMTKMEFSCGASKPIAQEILGTGRRQAIVAGMEAHVCVYQTARDLVERGFTPYLCRDAIISRTDEDREAGLALARDAGAVITTAECALFDLLGEAGTPEFRAISAAVK
jgi:nicotinamidase-related amidase